MSSPRTVLITGGNRGIGLATARLMAELGHRVAVSHRGSAPAELYAVQCDVTSTTDVDMMFAAVERDLGPVEVLVANAGVIDDAPLALMAESRFVNVLNTNLTGAFRCARRAAPPMVRHRWGRMIFIGSEVGFSGNAGQVNYAASKSALLGMARSIARELGPSGITVNTIAPGLISTDMTAGLEAAYKESLTKNLPVPRIGVPADVASTIAWLAGDAASYITGSLIPVDGGLGMGG